MSFVETYKTSAMINNSIKSHEERIRELEREIRKLELSINDKLDTSLLKKQREEKAASERNSVYDFVVPWQL
ncbi:MAG TPA: hypothetical protein VE912_19595 [Bacteroidales bacterium]|nr:hypothetical protein [Bacteroidales bacterium]